MMGPKTLILTIKAPILSRLHLVPRSKSSIAACCCIPLRQPAWYIVRFKVVPTEAAICRRCHTPEEALSESLYDSV